MNYNNKSFDINAFTTDKAKEINLVDFLKKLGYVPAREGINTGLFYSPLRADNNPSFSVFKKTRSKPYTWQWCDKTSSNEYGNIIDLVMRLEKINTVSGALKYIKSIEEGEIYIIQIQKNQTMEKKKDLIKNYEIKKIKILENQALIDYLNKRKIDITIAKKYLQEIYYLMKDKEGNIKNYFSLALQNDSGGYDLRNEYMKGNLEGKDITIIKGLSDENIILFEGSFSFLSALTYYKSLTPKYDTIILNSVSLIDKAFIYIEEKKPKKIYDFLDNDFAGQEAIINLKNKILNMENYKPTIINGFKIYQKFNDFNDFIRLNKNDI
jgi:hypothetical protein